MQNQLLKRIILILVLLYYCYHEFNLDFTSSILFVKSARLELSEFLKRLIIMHVKETPVLIFYILYFIWLFTVTYLTPEIMIVNYFTGGVALFYFIFLREKEDVLWFLIASLIPIIVTATDITSWQLSFNFGLVAYMPLWLPLAWGTTVVALRKFYISVAG